MSGEAPVQLDPPHWAIVSDLLQREVPELEVWAFGSRARRQAKPYSDLDLALITATPLSLSRRAALTTAFSESALPWRVDVVDWAETSPEFRAQIERDHVVIKTAR